MVVVAPPWYQNDGLCVDLSPTTAGKALWSVSNKPTSVWVWKQQALATATSGTTTV